MMDKDADRISEMLSVEVHLKSEGPEVTICVNDSRRFNFQDEDETDSVSSADSPVSSFRREPPADEYCEDRNDLDGMFRFEEGEGGAPLTPDLPLALELPNGNEISPAPIADGAYVGNWDNVDGPQPKAEGPSPSPSPQVYSWDAIITREIEKARRVAAQSVASDPTGMDIQIQSQLHDTKTSKKFDQQLFETSPVGDQIFIVDDAPSAAARRRSNRSFTVMDQWEEESQSDYNLDPLPTNIALSTTDDAEVTPKFTVSEEGVQQKFTLTELAPRGVDSTVFPRNLDTPIPFSHQLSPQQIPKKSVGESDREGDEKKDSDVDDRKSKFSIQLRNRVLGNEDELKLVKSLSMTESEVESVTGLPSNLQRQWIEDKNRREKIMKSLDGIRRSAVSDGVPRHANIREPSSEGIETDQPRKDEQPSFFSWTFNLLWGGGEGPCAKDDGEYWDRTSLLQQDDTLALLGCANLIHREDHSPMPTSVVRVMSELPPPSYAETVRAVEVDPRMKSWIESQFMVSYPPPNDGSYYLGRSRAVIVHEIARGDWTWCTAWSPNGDLLAIATENHQLAIVDTTSSPVWRVQHDKKLVCPARNNDTHAVRSIAWGNHYIAVGGTGNAVSIISPSDPYKVLHRIKGTGFVGGLDWLGGSLVLAIASRLEKALIVRVVETDDEDSSEGPKQVDCEILHTIKCTNWVNAVAFSPSGRYMAVGDAGGTLSVYNYHENSDGTVNVSVFRTFIVGDSILAIEWSPDGMWLYAGGEDLQVNVISTSCWEIVHRVKRGRWVQCISSSTGGTYMAVGGVSSEISILDVKNGWDSVMGIELKGLVPLSAKWHPKDQYLAVTGQNDRVLVVETTNARHVKGHHLQSISPVLAIEFSPDGRMVIIGNETGVVTFFSLSGSTFESAYELVVVLTDRISTKWSLNGHFAVIGSKDALIVVGRGRKHRKPVMKAARSAGFSVQKVLREFGEINAVSIDSHSHYVAVSGAQTWILDATANFATVREFKKCGLCLANAWSLDGRWLATVGPEKTLTIYDTGDIRVERWKAIFRINCEFVSQSLAWGPLTTAGLQYLAYGGDNNNVIIIEIRTHERTWETVLRLPRDGAINALDWSTGGLLAAAVGNGTVSVVDLSYLQSGIAVNERDYNWQRQALTCCIEIRRNRGKNSMRSVRWIPSAPGSDCLLAVGGTDGELEIVDLTERRRCSGYGRGVK